MKKAANCLCKTRLSAIRKICLAGLIFLFSLVAQSIYAQNSATSNLDTQLLQQKLKERDAVIEDLIQRVRSLERQQQTSTPQQQQPRSTAVVPVRKPQSPDQINPIAGSGQQTQTDSESQSQAKGKSSAGGFAVDEVAAERALDESLIQAGALLLPFRQMELQPFFNYTRRENDSPRLVANDLGQLIGVRTSDIQRNEFTAGLFFRAGLPFESQLELRLPARIVEQTSTIPVGTANVVDSTRTGAALGDISVGIAKTLFREDGWIPDLVGRFTWDSDSGKSVDNNVFMGSGFNDFRVSLTALKRQDPLAFTGRFDYQTTLKKNGTDRGDQYAFALGASLAASPYTSLSMSLQQIWRQKTTISNINVPGSDDVQSFMNFGVTTRVNRKLFFIVNGGIGLTDASPDYLINVSLPFRFSR